MGAVLLVTPRSDEAAEWGRLLRERIAGVDFRIHPEGGNPADVDVVLAWKPPHGLLATFPRLELICSLGMGVDHLLSDPDLPRAVPIARLVDRNMIEQMSEYALYAVLHFHRRFDVYERFQLERRWQELPLPHTGSRRVGVMGLGANGADCARKLAALGFNVLGWSRTPKHMAGVECLHGADDLPRFLRETEILVVALPQTAATAGILNARTLSLLPRGCYVVNMARGGLVVEADLLQALDSGQVAGAFLDVTEQEPLPADHPLWIHPNVRLTPHIAGLTNPQTAIEPIAENIRRLRDGQPLLDLIDIGRGY
ncbi:MAG: glyoxylate/hydroxypyruvate reductase A [Betaproteobacteria bacterium]|nr:glyoxylate/hydroxypyruvate reductase A [Betaproteobacteria bacterium]